ncbi:MAG: ABC transporter permease, partial [Rhodanobacteraceae bacterium]
MSMTQDLRFALRSLRARSGTALLAILTLAIGLGAALAILAVIDGVLVRDLPYPKPDRLVQLREIAADGHTMALAYPNYTDLAASVDAFDKTAFYTSFDGPITSSGNTVRALDAATGGDFFQVMSVAPLLGRTFAAGEHDKITVISYGLWQGLLHGRADVLGQPLAINGDDYTIIGVMPPDFAFPQRAALWSPVRALIDDLGTSRSAHNYEAVARLDAGGDLARARLTANALAGRITRQYGDAVDAVGFDVTPLGDAIAAPVKSALLLLAAGTAFLLLIAITNTTNLLLALNGARAREIA